MKKGLIHIYTGEGKGKTTASVGLAIRALAHNFNVVYASFFKKNNGDATSEITVLRNQGATIFSFSDEAKKNIQKMPMLNPEISHQEYHLSIETGLKELQTFIQENKPEMLVLDEILIAVKYGFISEDELIEFIKQKPENTEVVLTGRGASEKLKLIADYVSVLSKEKHPYDKGINARIGVEF